MKLRAPALFYLMFIVVGLIVSAPFVSSKTFGLYAQNRIGGSVVGVNRQPLGELRIELMDDLLRTIAQTRTNGAGHYEFVGMSSGRFVIHVYTFGTDYDEQEQSVEIQNTSFQTSDGQTRTTGFANETKDFYLRLRRGVIAANAVVFAENVPADAKKLYEKAVSDLDNKRVAEGLAELRSAIEIFPKYYAALERLGTEYIRLGKPESYQAAAVVLATAVDVNARGFKSWYGLAYSFHSLGKYPEGMVAAQKALDLNPSSPDALFLSGVLLRLTKKYAEAEKNLLKAKELSNDANPRVHWELALLYGKNLKRYADAARELKTFLNAQPNAKDVENIKKLIAEYEAKAQKT